MFRRVSLTAGGGLAVQRAIACALMSFEALGGDLQMLIVHVVVNGLSPLSREARALRSVNKCFSEQLQATYHQLRICRDTLPILRDRVEPEKLVKLVTSVMLDLCHTPCMGGMTLIVPFKIYHSVHTVFFETLNKAGQLHWTLHMQMHAALREIAWPLLRDAHFHDPELGKWCVAKMAHMMAPVDRKGIIFLHAPSYASFTVQQRLSGETPDVN